MPKSTEAAPLQKIGQAGRKTGVVAKQNVRKDEDDLENVEDFFASDEDENADAVSQRKGALASSSAKRSMGGGGGASSSSSSSSSSVMTATPGGKGAGRALATPSKASASTSTSKHSTPLQPLPRTPASIAAPFDIDDSMAASERAQTKRKLDFNASAAVENSQPQSSRPEDAPVLSEKQKGKRKAPVQDSDDNDSSVSQSLSQGRRWDDTSVGASTDTTAESADGALEFAPFSLGLSDASKLAVDGDMEEAVQDEPAMGKAKDKGRGRGGGRGLGLGLTRPKARTIGGGGESQAHEKTSSDKARKEATRDDVHRPSSRGSANESAPAASTKGAPKSSGKEADAGAVEGPMIAPARDAVEPTAAKRHSRAPADDEPPTGTSTGARQDKQAEASHAEPAKARAKGQQQKRAHSPEPETRNTKPRKLGASRKTEDSDDDSGAANSGSDHAARRSARTRVAPLEWWKNEKLVYERQNTGFVIKDVVKKEPSAPGAASSRRRRDKEDASSESQSQSDYEQSSKPVRKPAGRRASTPPKAAGRKSTQASKDTHGDTHRDTHRDTHESPVPMSGIEKPGKQPQPAKESKAAIKKQAVSRRVQKAEEEKSTRASNFEPEATAEPEDGEDEQNSDDYHPHFLQQKGFIALLAKAGKTGLKPRGYPSVPLALRPESQTQVPVYAKSQQDYTLVSLAKTPGGMKTIERSGSEEPGKNILLLSRAFSFTNWGAGSIVLTPHALKSNQNAGSHTVVFFVVYGQIEVQVHGSKFIVSDGSFFWVPPENQYTFRNLLDAESKMAYFQIHADKADKAASGSTSASSAN